MDSLATTLKTLTLITALATLLVPKQVTSQIPTQPTFFSAGCNATEEGSYIRNSAYSQNLNIVLTQLTDRASDAHFYNSSAGDGGSNTAYGQFYCRGDISTKLCQDCVKAATQVILEGGKCFLVMSNRIYFRECTLRYGNKSYVGLWTDTWTPAQQGSLTNVSNPTEFGQVTRGLIGTLIKKAAYGGDPMEFATGEGSVTQFETVYCLLQCSPDIVDVNCEGCLKSIARYLDDNYLAYGPEWVLLFYPNCQLRYSLSLFYSNSSAAPTPAPQPPSPNTLSPSASGKGKKNVIIIIAPAVIGSLFLLCGIAFAIWFCLFRRKRNTLSSSQTQQHKTTKGIDREESEIGNLECFSFRKIEEATMKFSVDNKLGEGGFGSVYKGILPGGHLVAIKRLSRNSGQGIREFKTEVAVVAKLQQRNLVRLVGFCVENEERILVYEYLSNLSLDKFIFDATKSFKLDWRTRYKIIEGIASGLRYLHVDSLLTIVHRDLKSSNILLDDEMNPKIADFGMARLVKVDETTRNTSRIAGTYGYMSPEYAMTGRFSIKADIYSFGVIILEILSGKSIIQFDDPVNGEGLLHYAWRIWNERAIERLVDPTLQLNYPKIEAERCLQIALLCIQDEATTRPPIRVVVGMLENQSLEVPYPSAPSNFFRSPRASIPSSDTEGGQFTHSRDGLYDSSIDTHMNYPRPR